MLDVGNLRAEIGTDNIACAIVSRFSLKIAESAWERSIFG